MTLTDLNRLLTVEEVAAQCQVRPREVLAWIQAGRLAHARLGKHIRVHSEDLEDFRKRNTVKVTP